MSREAPRVPANGNIYQLKTEYLAHLADAKYPVSLNISGPRFHLATLEKIEIIRSDALKELDVRKNKLTSLDGIERFHSLRKLVAFGNQLTNVNLLNGRLQEVDLSENRLQEFPDLSALPVLQKLNLAKNEIIGSLVLLQFGTKLQFLDLSGNGIDGGENEFEQILQTLSNLKNLTEIRLSGNPITKNVPDYKERIKARLPKIQRVDEGSASDAKASTRSKSDGINNGVPNRVQDVAKKGNGSTPKTGGGGVDPPSDVLRVKSELVDRYRRLSDRINARVSLWKSTLDSSDASIRSEAGALERWRSRLAGDQDPPSATDPEVISGEKRWANEVHRLTGEVSKKQDELAKKSEELAKYKAMVESLKAQLSNSQQSLETTERELKVKTRESEKWKSETQRLTSDLNEVVSERSTGSVRDADNDALKNNVRELQSEVEQWRNTADKIRSDLSGEITNLQEELRERDALIDKLTQQKDKYAKDRSSQEEELKRTTEEMVRWKDKSETLKNEITERLSMPPSIDMRSSVTGGDSASDLDDLEREQREAAMQGQRFPAEPGQDPSLLFLASTYASPANILCQRYGGPSDRHSGGAVEDEEDEAEGEDEARFMTPMSSPPGSLADKKERQRLMEETRARITQMKNGAVFFKYDGSTGRKREERFVLLSQDGLTLRWGEPKKMKKPNRSVSLSDIIRIEYGRKSPIFMKHTITEDGEWLCFSLFLKSRSLDFAATSDEQLMTWYLGLQYLLFLPGQPMMTKGKLMWERARMRVEFRAKVKGVSKSKLIAQALRDAAAAV